MRCIQQGLRLSGLLGLMVSIVACGNVALTDPQTLMDRGINRIARGDYAGAEDDFDAALALDQQNPSLFLHRGIALASQGKLLPAIADYSAAITQKSDYLEALIQRGYAYNQLARFDDALLDFSKVIARDPTHGDTFTYRSVTYYNLGRIQEAIADLMRAKVLFKEQNRPDKVAQIEKTLQQYQATLSPPP